MLGMALERFSSLTLRNRKYIDIHQTGLQCQAIKKMDADACQFELADISGGIKHASIIMYSDIELSPKVANQNPSFRCLTALTVLF